MKQVLIRQGKAVVEEVPAPAVERGTVLVAVESSCISIGTELSGLKASGESLLKKALRQPGKVKKVLQMAVEQGLGNAMDVVEGKMSAAVPTGYSAAGTIIQVGEGVTDFQAGDRVACAGAQCAHHAEIIRVPRNLTVKVPDELPLADASCVTLGAIALQGVRRANPTLGETFVVLGLGILGQLTSQILKANGCRVIGSDTDPERVGQALGLGMDLGISPQDGATVAQVARLTSGLGADGVIITAATPSHEVVSTAFQLCRKKGRVVLVGDVGLNLNRPDFYEKELDFLVSTSYGPGRYDRNYEEEGLDYPPGYVRWTENRNMEEFLRLVSGGRVRIAPLVADSYPLGQAPQAYESLQAPGKKPLMVLLSYPPQKGMDSPARRVANPKASPSKGGKLRLALVGAGSFAKGMHLPNLKSLSSLYHLRAVVSRTGHNAAAVAKQFGADYSATEYSEVLKDKDLDAVLIATRHHLHAPMALQALKAGKHVLVEKPLGLSQGELSEIQKFYEAAPQGKAPVLLTGYNRRFSRAARKVQEITSRRTHPFLLNYRMNAGFIPKDHWVHGPEGGGRNLGEACHIYDLFTFLTGSKVKFIDAQAITPKDDYYGPKDNFTALVAFEDGSLCSLTYTSLGSGDYPKERMEIFMDGKVVSLDDYRSVAVAGAPVKGLEGKAPDKGQREELEAFAKAIREGGDWPIPLWQQVQAAEIALRVEQLIKH